MKGRNGLELGESKNILHFSTLLLTFFAFFSIDLITYFEKFSLLKNEKNTFGFFEFISNIHIVKIVK